MRAFFHPDQALHAPQQFMRAGKVVAPKDLPIRTDRFLEALRRLGVNPERPSRDGNDARGAVHTAGFLAFLETAWDEWQGLVDHGPEVWPNTFPYWSGRPEHADRGECPADHIIAKTGWYLGDLSVALGPRSWKAIRASANSAVAAADALIEGGGMVYALCRPSGHHARVDRASGFCFLNNTAIAAQQLRTQFGRVAILDVDAHHGDGTQQIFYARADVLTVSIHADPRQYYPFFTGYASEHGIGDGDGFNVNLPLPHGADGPIMLKAIDDAIETIAAFQPDALIVALGFDAHVEDPIGVLRLQTADFASVGARVRGIGLPTLVVQEGGYAIDVIGDCLEGFLRALAA